MPDPAYPALIASTSSFGRRLLTLFWLFAAAVLMVNLGGYGLVEDNEGRFFEIAWEMLRGGDWLTPRMNFISHFHKPPGTPWAVGASFALFGPSEWSGRLPIVLASLGALSLVISLMRRAGHTLETALLTGLILLSSVEYWVLSRMVLTDMFLTLTVVGAMFCAWGAISSGDSRWSYGLAGWLGVSMMFKGPVGPAIVILTLLAFRLMGGEVSWRTLLRPGALVLFVAIGAPWYVLVCTEHEGLLWYFLHYQTYARVATEVHKRLGPPWFYLPVLLVGALPWSLAVPSAALRAWRSRAPFEMFLLAWLVGPLLLFSASGSKLLTYALPLFPALAMLVGAGLADAAGRLRAARFGAGGLSFLAVAVTVVAQWNLPPDVILARHVVQAVSVLLLTGALVATVMTARKMTRCAILATVATLCFVFVLLSFGAGLADSTFSGKALSQRILQHLDSQTVVAELDEHVHALPYYLDRRLVHIHYFRETQFMKSCDLDGWMFDGVDDFTGSLKSGQKPLIVAKAHDFDATRYPGFSCERVGAWMIMTAPAKR